MDRAAAEGDRLSETPEVAAAASPLAPSPVRTWPPLDLVAVALLVAASVILVSVGVIRTSAAGAMAAGGIAGGLALVLVARRSMEAFVLVVLVLRASLDGLHRPGAESWTDPAPILAAVFAIVGVVWLLGRRFGGRRHPVSAVAVALAAFLAAATLSTLTSQAPRQSAGELARLAVAALMFFVVDRVCEDSHRPDRFLLAVVAAAAVPVTVALAGPLVGLDRVEVKDRIERVVSTFAQSNPFGHFLAIVVIVLAAYVLVGPRHRRGWALLAAVPVVLTLALTYTRLAWGAAAIALVVMVWLSGRRWLSPVILVALLGAAVLSPSVGNRVERLMSRNAVVAGSESALGWRWSHWVDVYHLAEDNPVTGIGPDVVARRLPDHQPPHNDYLRAFVEYGVLGFGAFVGLLATLVLSAVSALRRASGLDAKSVALAFVGVVTTLVVTSVAANVLGQIVLLWYVFALAAAGAWVARHHRIASSDEPTASSARWISTP
jgi:O-antigen ligase